MTQALATKSAADSLEKALIGGDLATLTTQERIGYYKQTCESLGLNPLTKPFEYIKLNGKLTLYARKDCTDQLRKIHSISIDKPDVQQIGDLIVVSISAKDATGRLDSDLGVVKKGDMNNAANELMKAITKAKRRVTLSLCGLGMLDETEVETIPNAQFINEDGSPQQLPPHDDGPPFSNASPAAFEPQSAMAERAVELATKLQKNHGVKFDDLAAQFLPEGVGKFSDLTEEQAAGVVPGLAELLTAKVNGR